MPSSGVKQPQCFWTAWHLKKGTSVLSRNVGNQVQTHAAQNRRRARTILVDLHHRLAWNLWRGSQKQLKTGCRIQCKVVHLDDWLTVHPSITLVDLQLDAQNSCLFTYNTFIKILYMFRALPCSSSGGLRRNNMYAASGIVTLCRWHRTVTCREWRYQRLHNTITT